MKTLSRAALACALLVSSCAGQPAFAIDAGFAFTLVRHSGFAVTLARDSGQWNDVPDNVRTWFKSVRSPNGVPCCDVSDGHRTAYDIRPQQIETDSGYWVPIDGEWRSVPTAAVVHNAGNPIGEAVVWYVRNGENSYYIRCFVPGGGV